MSSLGNFGNDSALDWVDLDLATAGPNILRTTLQNIAGATGETYLEAPQCQEALAAAEIVAAIAGQPSNDLPEKASEWIANNPVLLEKELLDLARRAVSRISSNSELKDLFDETTKHKDNWHKTLKDLDLRLRTARL